MEVQIDRLSHAQMLMLMWVPRPSYPPDLTTPIHTLRDAIEAQIERAYRLQQECEKPVRKAA